MEQGEDWRGLIGYIARAEAAVAAAQGRLEEAETQFEQAIETFRRYSCVWDEAEALHLWGRALLNAEERMRAIEKFDAALEVYQRHGAGAIWLERVLADKMRAQGIDPAAVGSSIAAVTVSVQSERPDLQPHAASDGTVTLLFTDIADSTPMAERLGDERWLELIRAHNAMVREQVEAHSGIEVTNRGDGFMVTFQSPSDGVQCALAIQRAFTEYNRDHAEEPIAVRIGLHTGEPARDEENFYGTDVNLTARIADDVADGGEIVVSSRLRDLLEGEEGMAFGEGREVTLKGLSGTQRVFSVAR